MSIFRRIWNYLVSLRRRYQIGGAIVLVLLIIIGTHLFSRAAPAPAATSETPHVTLSTVSGLASASGPLTVTGKVTSLNQATILAQTSGEVIRLSVAIGDHVGAGQVIGQFENSSEQAAVTQAQGAYDAAVAAASESSLPTTQTSARDTYTSAYATVDSDLQNDVDLSFGNETPSGPQLLFTAQNSLDISRAREQMKDLINTWHTRLANAGSADPQSLLVEAYQDTQSVSNFVNNLSNAAHTQNSGASTAQLAGIATAQTSLASLLSTISAAQASYQSKSVSSTAGANASITQAQGGLDAAKAALAKTIIRSPISGTIVSLPITQGDFVSAFSQVAEVSNPSALEIDVQVTPDDAKSLAVGNNAMIDGDIRGTIADVAPAIDPTTGKILIKVDIDQGNGSLVDGDTVSVDLTRNATAPALTTTTAATSLSIPIVAAKITPTGAIVFTVASSTLAAHPITLGAIIGDRVTVLNGLTPDLQIVTDARGLADGETVIVDNQ